MKTPRETLLARHAGAQPELDELSQGVVEKMRRASEPGAVASAPRSASIQRNAERERRFNGLLA